MKITNNYSLPESIAQAVSKWIYKPSPDRISVSDLIGSSWIRKLKLERWEELTEDVSDRLWALLGQAIHSVLDKVEIEETLTEERLIAQHNGVTISGRIDLYHGVTKTIEDYKVTSVWSFLLGEKKEWGQQLNIYKWLYEQAGFEVTGLKIHAILRDWNQREKEKNKDYPPIPFMTIDIPIMPNILQFIESRIEAHRNPQPCSDEERWLRGEAWAVKKAGNKTALRVFNSEQQAKEFMEDYLKQYQKVQLEIEHRAGRYVRCESYCPVRSICTEKKGDEKNGN